MGYNTTLTINNDALDAMLDDPKEFCETVERTASAGPAHAQDFGFGMFANCLRIHAPRHRSEDTLYVQYGGAVHEISSFSSDTENLMRRNPAYVREVLDYMSSQVQELRQTLSEMHPEAD